MFLPIGDEPNPQGTPVATYVLLGINIAVFLLITLPLTSQRVDIWDPALREYVRQLASETGLLPRVIADSTSAYDLFVFKWGFRPAAPSLVTLISSMFLHAGWMHLLGNMLFLWIFGDNLEFHLGRKRYVLMYLGTGAIATIFFALLQSGSNIPLLGASGAISGVLGCYYVWFARNRVRVLVIWLIFIQVIMVPARWVLAFYLLVDNLLPFLLQDGSGGVAHGAHIGGFFAGLGYAFFYDRWFQQRSLRGARRTPRVTQATTFTEAIKQSEWSIALKHYAEIGALERREIPDWDLLHMADGLTEAQQFESALAVLQRFVATRPNSSVLALAHLRIGLIFVHGLNRSPAGYQHLLTVLDLEPDYEVQQEARRALEYIKTRRRVTTLH